MTIVLDSGALIAVERRDRFVRAALQAAEQDGTALRTSAAAVAQVWRDGARQARIARLLPGVHVMPLSSETAKHVGQLLAANRSIDVVDAHVALLVEPGGELWTSDEPELKALLRTRGTKATIVRVT